MIWYCHRCKRRLRISEIKCPYCRRAAISWLHVVVFAAFALTAILYAVKNF